LAESASYSETDLETALNNNLQRFLLELGKGFLFEARQRRFTSEEKSFFVDLVFYKQTTSMLRSYRLESRRASPSGLRTDVCVNSV
jgi:predicted nuclease of restriction endonuclease-like (RecB) superfamily